MIAARCGLPRIYRLRLGIGKYYQSENYISHTNTSKGLVNRLYHIVRNYTLNSKKKLVQSVSKRTTGNLLDVGAGVGAFAGFMRAAGWGRSNT